MEPKNVTIGACDVSKYIHVYVFEDAEHESDTILHLGLVEGGGAGWCTFPSLISAIAQFMRLTCVMFGVPKKSKELRYAICKISFSPKLAAHFENS